MAKILRKPGIYVREIPAVSPVVAEVETAVPAFIGYTEKTSHNETTLFLNPVKIHSLTEYEELFGLAHPVQLSTAGAQGIRIKRESGTLSVDGGLTDPFLNLHFRMHYAIKLYFANGGGSCFVCSCGDYSATVSKEPMAEALEATGRIEGPTVIVFTDAVALDDAADAYALYKDALNQSERLADRMVLVDLIPEKSEKGRTPFDLVKNNFRSAIGNINLEYGAAYYPWLQTSMDYYLDEQAVPVVRGIGVTPEEIPDNTVLRSFPAGNGGDEQPTTPSLFHLHPRLYEAVKVSAEQFRVIMPPSPAMAGIYALTDRLWGVWKSPANLSINLIDELLADISDEEQQDMNMPVHGQSVNAIRKFPGRGILVWGARTLAGNNNEWRYVAVRRLCIAIETSLRKALATFSFEPNEPRTWTKIKTMVENYLVHKWREGALMGITASKAFFVRVGLGITMTSGDVRNGRLILETGLAVIRPSEFIIIRIEQQMTTA